jgi:hypothetical protein
VRSDEHQRLAAAYRPHPEPLERFGHEPDSDGHDQMLFREAMYAARM